MDRRSILAGVLSSVLSVVVCAAGAKATELHVAPNGQDANPGTAQAPLQTLEGARNAIRKLSQGKPLQEPATVILHNGVYCLESPFTLTPEDSGSKTAPITYRAAESGKAVISGGRPIQGWKKGQGELWQVEIPAVRDGKWYFHALFVNGQRRTRARTPNDGFLRMEGTTVPYPRDRKAIAGNREIRTAFRYKPGDLDPQWKNPQDINLFLYHSWTNSLHWLDKIDAAKHVVSMTNSTGWPIGWWEKNARYYVENAREALDSPGEWYLDRKTGLLEYWPLPGEDLAKAEVFAPVLDQLVKINGDWPHAKPVHDVNFVGLRFLYTDWLFPDKTKTLDGQSGGFLSAAIEANGAERITFDHCEIGHIGTYGMYLNTGCKHNRIVHCEVHDLGAGGIRIGETGNQSQTMKDANGKTIQLPLRSLAGNSPRDTGHNTIDNNFIHDGGHVFAAGTGVFVGHSGFNRITHNEICDLYYSGVCVGWTWGFTPSVAHHNRIADNHIHHLGWGVLSDMGGVYTLGPSPGTVVAHNLVHHVCAYSYGGWGLYTDEGSSNILLENNVVYDTKSGGFHQHYGADNTIRNNIFAFSREAQIRRSREDKRCALTFEHNIVYCDNDQVLSRVWRNGDYHVDYNMYWTTAQAAPLFDNRDFDEWRATSKQDAHSIMADPQFVDPAHRNFQLKPQSSATQIGFQLIDMSGFGLYGEPEWVAAPTKVVRPEFVLPETAKPMPDAMSDDFEQTPVGERPQNATVLGESGTAAIRVAAHPDASGKHALQFTDAAGLSRRFNPHMSYKLNCRQGVYRGSFDVRPSDKTNLIYEWRDTASPYRSGPAIRIDGAGNLTVGGKTLATLPPDQWTHIEVVCGVGRDAQGVFDLAITKPNATPQRFEKLPCGRKDFSRLQWLGFIADADQAATTYVDNIQLLPAK